MKTNKDLKVVKGAYSCIPDNVLSIPKGAPVEYSDGEYWLVPCIETFPGAIDRHDARHYGFRVKAEDVEK